MRTIIAAALSALMTVVCGCDSRLDDQRADGSYDSIRKDPAVLPLPSGEGPAADARRGFAMANSLETAGRHSEALLVYRRIGSLSPQFADEAGLGAARCLLAMDRPAPALAALEPLGVPAANCLEREKLALAGQALLLQRKYKTAESALSRALNGAGEECSGLPWEAAAYANFGKALLENDKTGEASRAYGTAARLYAVAGRMDKAATCRDLQATIDEWLAERYRRGY